MRDLSLKTFWRHPWHLMLIGLGYVPFLWRFAVPMTGDQKTYISIAMEMRQKGEWLTPLLFGESNYLKPPFQYWMTLLGWKIFGFNLFGTFIPSVLGLLGTAWFLNEISSLLGERRWHVSSGLWFAATLGALTFGSSAQMEIYLCLFFSASWWAALHYLSSPDYERQPRWLYVAFLVAGLCSWVKSPLYSVLWVVSFLSYLLVSGEWLLFKSRHLYLSLLTGVMAGLIWFILILIQDGDRFWLVYWQQEQAGKIGGNGGTLKNLWIPLLYLAFPLTVLLVPAIRSVFIGRRTTDIARVVLCWCWPPALFFSLYPYRTSIYLFITVPALAILVDWGCFRGNRTRTFRWFARGTAAISGLGFVLLAMVAWKLGMVSSKVLLLMSLAALASSAALAFGWIRSFLALLFVCILCVRWASTEVMRPTQENLRAALPDRSSYRIGMLDESRNIWHELGLLSVEIEKPIERLRDFDDLLELLESEGVAILSDEEWSRYSMTLESALRQRGWILKATIWKRFRRGAKVPVKALLLRGRESIPNWDALMYRDFQVVTVSKLESSP